jgi:cytochrome c-type biogenesis protein CcmH/NrfG
VFVGDASERQMRDIAQRLEQFRDVVGRVFSDDTTHSPVPATVVVFENDRSFSPFKPVYQGRPVEVAGYFVGMEDASFIAVNAEQDTDAYAIIFHEYAHFLTGTAVGAVPVWASEGLAELYETFDSRNGGRTATIGSPSKENLQLLKTTPSLLPLSQLIAVDHESPMYNEGDRRRLFYAQSWALVHYLTFGSQARRGQLKTYLSLVMQGEPGPAAFSKAFGADAGALEQELQRYVRAAEFQAVRVTLPPMIDTATLLRGEVLSESDAAGYLGDMMARLNRTDDARGYLQSTLAANPSAARAMMALGLLELRAANDDVAYPLLEKAASLAPGMASVQAAYGRALTRRADRGGADDEELYARARTALARAMELEPDNVSTVVTLAEVEMGSGANPGRAVALMQRAIEAARGREEYRLMLAQAYAVNGDYRTATAELEALAARTTRPEIRTAALEARGRVADAERDARNLVSAASREAARAALADPPEPPRPDAPQGSFVPTLRSVQDGETRVLGAFADVECRPGAIVLRVDTDKGPVRLAVKTLADVDFLTYRQDTPTSVACGAQRPAFRVLATYRTDAPIAGADTPNRAIAVELLPDGFTP